MAICVYKNYVLRVSFVIIYEFEKFVDCFFFGDVFHYAFLSFVEGYFAHTGTDVAKVGICHLTWSIDDAAHDGDFESDEALCCFFDLAHDFR